MLSKWLKIAPLMFLFNNVIVTTVIAMTLLFCHHVVRYNLLSVLLFNYHKEFYYLNEIFLECFSKFVIPRLLLKVVEVGHTFLLVKLCFAVKWLFHFGGSLASQAGIFSGGSRALWTVPLWVMFWNLCSAFRWIFLQTSHIAWHLCFPCSTFSFLRNKTTKSVRGLRAYSYD